ncbi:MAG: sensor histidine kinase [Pikeienuella sp.]
MATGSADPRRARPHRARAPLSLLGRLLLAAGLLCGLTVAVAAVVLIGLFREHLVREAETELRDQLVELVALTRIDRMGQVRLSGTLPGARFQRPFSGWGWQIRRGETVLAQSLSLGPAPGAPVLAAPVGRLGVFRAVDGRRLRGLSRAVAPRFHRTRLTFAIARPEAEIERAVGQFRAAVLIALGLLSLGIVATASAALWIGLRPLGELRGQIALMRQGEVPAARAWPREIAPIAAEIDALSRHTERLIAHARGLSADLAHAIKTPLSVIRQEAERLEPEPAEALARQADRIGRSLARHLGRSAAGGMPHARVAVAPCLAELADALAHGRVGRPLEIRREVTPGAVFRGDAADLYEILGNPLDNAAKWARQLVTVHVRAADGRLEIDIEDDGPGIPAAERAAILERGRRLDESTPGHGLGLAILADLVELYGGSLSLGDSALGGLAVRLSLPGG